MNKITVLGLGAGEKDQLTLGTYRLLQQTSHLYMRTKEHPVVTELEQEGLSYTSFDAVYEAHDTFEEVYQSIVTTLIEQAREGDVVYAVPGHPLVAERTVQLLIEREKQGEIQLDIQGGQSFLDPLFASVKIDPIEGFQLVDATAFKRHDLQLRQHIIFGQVYDAFVASDVKLALMEMLPDEYEVYIVTAAGTSFERVRKIPLYELDRATELDNLTSVYIPPVQDETLLHHDFTALRTIIATLRGPNGCPWDKKQTHQSLKKYAIEEVYELLDAIDEEDDDHIVEELGDVLLQVMLHAQIGEEEGWFSIDDVIRTLSDKMVRRHPHVFGDVQVSDAAGAVMSWDAIKKGEKEEEPSSILEGVPGSFPQLMQAYELQKKAATVGFDWRAVQPMMEKVNEEWQELQEEITKMDEDRMLREYGDLLFAFVNIARFYHLNPEEALYTTNRKFRNRFAYIEQRAKEMNKDVAGMTLEEMDVLWEEAKQNGVE